MMDLPWLVVQHPAVAPFGSFGSIRIAIRISTPNAAGSPARAYPGHPNVPFGFIRIPFGYQSVVIRWFIDMGVYARRVISEPVNGGRSQSPQDMTSTDDGTHLRESLSIIGGRGSAPSS